MNLRPVAQLDIFEMSVYHLQRYDTTVSVQKTRLRIVLNVKCVMAVFDMSLKTFVDADNTSFPSFLLVDGELFTR